MPGKNLLLITVSWVEESYISFSTLCFLSKHIHITVVQLLTHLLHFTLHDQSDVLLLTTESVTHFFQSSFSCVRERKYFQAVYVNYHVKKTLIVLRAFCAVIMGTSVLLACP